MKRKPMGGAGRGQGRKRELADPVRRSHDFTAEERAKVEAYRIALGLQAFSTALRALILAAPDPQK